MMTESADMASDNRASAPHKSASPLRMRLRRFRRLKRGYYSFLVLLVAYLASFFLPFLMNNRAVLVYHDGHLYLPALRNYLHDTFNIGGERIYMADIFDQTDARGRPILGEVDYRSLRERFQTESSGNVAILPPFPFGPNEALLELAGNPPHAPSFGHWMGTDDRARDVMVRLAYGFRISLTFALLVITSAYAIGILIGSTLGFFGRWIDIVGQRFVEIWSTIPFLYTVIIMASVFGSSFWMLVVVLTSFSWMAITYYIRGEFYREKTRDYVAAAIATGEGSFSIMFRHILPNALTPIITFAPFAIVATIVALVSLDFLGYGLPPPTPSWGELLQQAKANLRVWHLVVFPLSAIFVTLQLIVFVGEAVREAFDPKVISRLR